MLTLEVAELKDVRSLEMEKKTIWWFVVFWQDFRWSSCWITVVPPPISCSWAHLPIQMYIDHWKLPKNFSFFVQFEHLELDLGRKMVIFEVNDGENCFEMIYIYILPMFCNILKIKLFKVKLSIKVVSFYVQSQPGLQTRIWDHFWLLSTSRVHWRSRNSQSSYSWKVHFWGKLLCTILRAILVYMISGLYFRSRAHPHTCLDKSKLILDSNCYFKWWMKISQFGWFCL